MFFHVGFGLGYIITTAVKKFSSWYAADADLEENSSKMETPEDCLAFTVPQQRSNLDANVSSKDENAEPQSSADVHTVRTSDKPESSIQSSCKDGRTVETVEHVLTIASGSADSSVEEHNMSKSSEPIPSTFGNRNGCSGFEEHLEDEVCAKEISTTKNEHGTADENSTESSDSTGAEAEDTVRENTVRKPSPHALNQEHPTNSDLAPVIHVCQNFRYRLANVTMHSIMNLKVIKKYLAQDGQQACGESSGHPSGASRDNPEQEDLPTSRRSCSVQQFDITKCMKFVRRESELLELNRPCQRVGIFFLVNFVLTFFKMNAVKTTCKILQVMTCFDCEMTGPVLTELGDLIKLKNARPNDTTASLFERHLQEASSLKKCCSSCTIENICILDTTDVISMFLHRQLSDGGPLVTPSATIEVPLVMGSQLFFCLSSVICCEIQNSQTYNFYTYVICGQEVYKIEDELVTKADEGCVEDMKRRGFIYFYEKYAGGEDKFSFQESNYNCGIVPTVVNYRNESEYYLLSEDTTDDEMSKYDQEIYGEFSIGSINLEKSKSVKKDQENHHQRVEDFLDCLTDLYMIHFLLRLFCFLLFPLFTFTAHFAFSFSHYDWAASAWVIIYFISLFIPVSPEENPILTVPPPQGRTPDARTCPKRSTQQSVEAQDGFTLGEVRRATSAQRRQRSSGATGRRRGRH